MEKGRGQGAGDRNVARRTGRFIGKAASSRWLQKALTGTVLAAIAAALLYIPAVLAYLFLYYKFRPDMMTTVPVHLQYGVGPNPFGIASVERILSRQAYDITVSLTLPRSPANLGRGNFMIALHLLAPAATGARSLFTSGTLPYFTPANTPTSSSDSSSQVSLLQPTRIDLASFLAAHEILYTTTRPALIPYIDPVASLASRCLFVLYHMLFPHSSTSIRLTIPMAEQLAFVQRRGGGYAYGTPSRLLPESLLLEVQAGQAIQVYEAGVTFVPRLRGLTGFMYRWRVTAFVLFTGGFWAAEVMLFLLGLLVMGQGLHGSLAPLTAEERVGSDDDLDDGRFGVLVRGEGRVVKRESRAGEEGEEKRVKKEEKEEETKPMFNAPEFNREQGAGGDDESEKEDGEGKAEEIVAKGEFGSENLGVGTSYSPPAGRDGARRRNAPGQETSE